MHLIHSIAARKDMTYVCPQNEQSASFAADAYARLTGVGCALATSGPGATNLVTGIAASYYDSVPVVYITGNQATSRLRDHVLNGRGDYITRQLGFQETPITEICKAITKKSNQVATAQEVIPALIEAIEIAKHGRPGPVLIDIPDDIQRCSIP